MFSSKRPDRASRTRSANRARYGSFFDQLEDRTLMSVAPTGAVDKFTGGAITGWAADADVGTTPITVRITVDGASTDVTADIVRPDGHNGFTFNLSPGKHKVTIAAVDPENASLKTLKSGKFTNPAPTGGVSSVSNTQVVGFATDKTDSTATLAITVKVDGVVNATVTADQAKPAGAKGNGPSGHWFSADLTGVDTGAHFIEIFATDVNTGEQVLIASQTLNNHVPQGTVDTVSSTTISGSAFDPDNPSAPVQIIVQVDKTQYSPVSASGASGDPGLPDPNHGFSITTPTVLFGKHKVKIIAIDPLDGSQTVIGTKTFVNNAPGGKLESASATSLKGYVYDPDHPTDSIEYLVVIDGNIAARLTANGDRPDLVKNKKIGSANHGIDISLNGLSSGKHVVQLFGVDPDSGVTKLIGKKTIRVA
jgi:hypothetical protein